MSYRVQNYHCGFILTVCVIVQSAVRKNRGLLDKNAKSTKLTGIVQGCLRMLILSFRIPRPCARAVVGQNPQNFRQGFYDFLTLKPFYLLYFAR